MAFTSLSGNEIFCLAQKGWTAGNLVMGNCAQSMGFAGSFGVVMRSFMGGEVEAISGLIGEGRAVALRRLEEEAKRQGANGVAGVKSDLRKLGGSIYEFLMMGSAINAHDQNAEFFSTVCSGQELFCQLDAGYEPRSVVLGNIAYSIGSGRVLRSLLRKTTGGEIKELTEAVNYTRHQALERLEKDASERGANSITDINTFLLPFKKGIREMLMIGSACVNDHLEKGHRPVTSDLSGAELWNLSSMGYQPLRLVFSTSVVALGLAGRLGTFVTSLKRGEVKKLTRLVYDARQRCLTRIQDEANGIQAEGVIGIKLLIHEHGGGLVEVLAIGTAIGKNEKCIVRSDRLLPQAIIQDRPTFFDKVHGKEAHLLE